MTQREEKHLQIGTIVKIKKIGHLQDIGHAESQDFGKPWEEVKTIQDIGRYGTTF
jgi:hypothetical protein